MRLSHVKNNFSQKHAEFSISKETYSMTTLAVTFEEHNVVDMIHQTYFADCVYCLCECMSVCYVLQIIYRLVKLILICHHPIFFFIATD